MPFNSINAPLYPHTFMKRISILASYLLTSFLLSECKVNRSAVQESKVIIAQVETNNWLTCCDPNTMLADKPVWCEASAVLYDRGLVYVANDKEMPAGLSPVFTKPFNRLSDTTLRVTPLLAEEFLRGRKYEDFASNKDYIFLTTAFDRVKPGSTDWDAYNTLLYWKKGDEAHPQVLSPDQGAKNSVAYRNQISRVLAQGRPDFTAGVPYFKIEGLAVMDSLLILGVREDGQTFEKFDYRIKLIAVPYFIEKSTGGERLVLKDNWRVVNDFTPKLIESLPSPQALSSIEYDPNRKRFWLLTSVEGTGGRLDGFLWTATPTELLGNQPFTLVRDQQGQPVHFGHKAEDITFLPDNRLLIIHDDDRTVTTVNSKLRQPNQAAYSIVTIR